MSRTIRNADTRWRPEEECAPDSVNVWKGSTPEPGGAERG